MGYNIGIRLVDEFLAKSGLPPCSGFVETAEVVAKVRRRKQRGQEEEEEEEALRCADAVHSD
eukprot:scaffold3349_cov246-Pinguiococcus_pyrenoidosus.AAC.8